MCHYHLLSPSFRGLHTSYPVDSIHHLLHICLLDIWSWYTQWTVHTMSCDRSYVRTLCSYCSQVNIIHVCVCACVCVRACVRACVCIQVYNGTLMPRLSSYTRFSCTCCIPLSHVCILYRRGQILSPISASSSASVLPGELKAPIHTLVA